MVPLLRPDRGRGGPVGPPDGPRTWVAGARGRNLSRSARPADSI